MNDDDSVTTDVDTSRATSVDSKAIKRRSSRPDSVPQAAKKRRPTKISYRKTTKAARNFADEGTVSRVPPTPSPARDRAFSIQEAPRTLSAPVSSQKLSQTSEITPPSVRSPRADPASIDTIRFASQDVSVSQRGFGSELADAAEAAHRATNDIFPGAADNSDKPSAVALADSFGSPFNLMEIDDPTNPSIHLAGSPKRSYDSDALNKVPDTTDSQLADASRPTWLNPAASGAALDFPPAVAMAYDSVEQARDDLVATIADAAETEGTLDHRTEAGFLRVKEAPLGPAAGTSEDPAYGESSNAWSTHRQGGLSTISDSDPAGAGRLPMTSIVGDVKLTAGKGTNLTTLPDEIQRLILAQALTPCDHETSVMRTKLDLVPLWISRHLRTVARDVLREKYRFTLLSVDKRLFRYLPNRALPLSTLPHGIAEHLGFTAETTLTAGYVPTASYQQYLVAVHDLEHTVLLVNLLILLHAGKRRSKTPILAMWQHVPATDLALLHAQRTWDLWQPWSKLRGVEFDDWPPRLQQHLDAEGIVVRTSHTIDAGCTATRCVRHRLGELLAQISEVAGRWSGVLADDLRLDIVQRIHVACNCLLDMFVVTTASLGATDPALCKAMTLSYAKALINRALTAVLRSRLEEAQETRDLLYETANAVFHSQVRSGSYKGYCCKLHGRYDRLPSASWYNENILAQMIKAVFIIDQHLPAVWESRKLEARCLNIALQSRREVEMSEAERVDLGQQMLWLTEVERILKRRDGSEAR